MKVSCYIGEQSGCFHWCGSIVAEGHAGNCPPRMEREHQQQRMLLFCLPQHWQMMSRAVYLRPGTPKHHNSPPPPSLYHWPIFPPPPFPLTTNIYCWDAVHPSQCSVEKEEKQTGSAEERVYIIGSNRVRANPNPNYMEAERPKKYIKLNIKCPVEVNGGARRMRKTA
jgi:hypothetical protein